MCDLLLTSVAVKSSCTGIPLWAPGYTVRGTSPSCCSEPSGAHTTAAPLPRLQEGVLACVDSKGTVDAGQTCPHSLYTWDISSSASSTAVLTLGSPGTVLPNVGVKLRLLSGSGSQQLCEQLRPRYCRTFACCCCCWLGFVLAAGGVLLLGAVCCGVLLLARSVSAVACPWLELLGPAQCGAAWNSSNKQPCVRGRML